MAKMLKTQSEMIELHKTRIQKGDAEHVTSEAMKNYTVFEDGSYVLLDPATGKPKTRLHSRRTGPFLVIDHEDSTYRLENLVTKNQFRVNIHRMHPFHFDPDRVNPQEVAAQDVDEFIVETIVSHEGDFKKKGSLKFKVRWLGYGPEHDSDEPWKNVMYVDKLHEYLRAHDLAKHIPKQFKEPSRT
jgi:hypothetical protein